MTAHDPAYPCETLQFTPAGYDRHPGLTKRELFAAMAMQGYCAREGSIECNADDIVVDSVALADALLAELAKDGAP